MTTLITVLGPTASGKTRLATQLALAIDAEIISADSRQVYRGMDVGTGKDLADYTVDGKCIPYHLIDIVEAGTKYNLFEYQRDFMKAFEDIRGRNKTPLLCGGTGLYIDAVTHAYNLLPVPVNSELRSTLKDTPIVELVERLKTYGPLHNKTDIENHKRLMRAIEIAEYTRNNPTESLEFVAFDTLFLGVDVDRNNRRARITSRLKQRLEEGLIEEVEALIAKGVSPDDLLYYGLEYKFVTQYVIGEISKNDMYQRLNSAIHQFSKRQMTWFRKMEKEGTKINWINGHLPIEGQVEQALALVENFGKKA